MKREKSYCMTGDDGRVHQSGHLTGLHGKRGRVCHPVVVLAPAVDSIAVQLLDKLLIDRGYAAGTLADLAMSLRAVGFPPKPDEPTGLGAVVEDAAGDKWVRSHPEPRSWTRPHLSGAYLYDEIDVVRVLSEGVTE